MSNDGALIAEIWMTLSNYMRENELEHAAKELMHILEAYGLTDEDYDDMLLDYEDPILKKAIELYAVPDTTDYEEFEE